MVEEDEVRKREDIWRGVEMLKADSVK